MDKIYEREGRSFNRAEERRQKFKSRNFAVECQRARRAAVLERQRTSRRNLTATLRSIASTRQAEHAETTLKTSVKKRHKRGFKPWKEAPLAMPEWLLEVPEHLADEWFVVPRVDGKRCIVVAHNGLTTIRSRHGAFLRRGGPFPSPFPGGSRPSSEGGRGGMTVFDCIFPEQDECEERHTVYILDVMMWNGKDLYDCSAEFRFAWLESIWNEVLTIYDEVEATGDGFPVDFRLLPYFDADSSGIRTACNPLMYSLPARLDGLLFYLRDGPYVLGVTPLILIWKDAATSSHLIETVPEPPPEYVPVEDLPLVVSLRGCKTGHDTIELLTSDNPPMNLGEMDTMQDIEEENRRLLRFKVLDTLNVSNGDQELQLEYLGLGGKSRAQPDSWSRIEFQCRARHRPITLEEILHAVDRH